MLPKRGLKSLMQSSAVCLN